MGVTGIGGMFFRSEDPRALLAWYQEHLGIMMEGSQPWEQAGGPTMFMPFDSATGYWPADKQWMVNFRVNDLDAMLTKLREAGVAVVTDPSWDTAETGRFARIQDPEGNPIELWEAPAQ